MQGKNPISDVKLLDCMQGMRAYPDKFFELAIVDPPYGIGMGGSLNVNSKTNFIEKAWDTEIPTDEYFIELQRVSQNQIIWGGNYFPFVWDAGCKGFIHWDKMNHHDNRADGELAWTSFNRPSMNFRYMWDGNRYGFDGKISGVGKPTIRIHPTEKPVALYRWILQNYAMCKKCNNSGIIQEAIGEKWMGTQDVDCEYCDVAINGRPKILDTHLGSGSSRIAAYLMGFDFYGFEIDKDYYEAQEKRFKEQTAQGSLFNYREAI